MTPRTSTTPSAADESDAVTPTGFNAFLSRVLEDEDPKKKSALSEDADNEATETEAP